MFNPFKNHPKELDIKSIISKIISIAQQNPSFQENILTIWSDGNQHSGVPINIYNVNGKDFLTLFTPNRNQPGTLSILSADHITAISTKFSDMVSDIAFNGGPDKYDTYSTPSQIEIHNRVATLEISISETCGPKKIQIIWTTANPEIHERFFIHKALVQFEEIFRKINKDRVNFFEGFDEFVFKYEDDFTLDAQSSNRQLIFTIGPLAQVSQIHQDIKSIIDRKIDR